MCSIAEDLNRRWCDDEKNRRSLKLRRSKNIRPVRTGRIFLDFCGLNHRSKPRLELFRILKIQSKPFRLISAVTQYHLDIYCHRYIEHSTRHGVNHHCGVHHHCCTFFVVDADFVTWLGEMNCYFFLYYKFQINSSWNSVPSHLVGSFYVDFNSYVDFMGKALWREHRFDDGVSTSSSSQRRGWPCGWLLTPDHQRRLLPTPLRRCYVKLVAWKEPWVPRRTPNHTASEWMR